MWFTCAERGLVCHDCPMGLPAELLGQGEVEELHLRTHAKALIVPALVLLLVAIAVGLAFAFLPSPWAWAGWVIAVLAALVFILWSLVPYLRWYTTTYTFTNRRIITRRGIINKSGHDLPLTRINNVAYESSLMDRFFRCGTLKLTTAAEEPVILEDIPDVERVHVVMNELLFAGDDPIKRAAQKDE
jgi:membrane protein YdbS with pleckstrin-like domain